MSRRKIHNKKSRIRFFVIISVIVIIIAIFIYSSGYYRLITANYAYSKFEHPSWSVRIERISKITGPHGSGGNHFYYLLDIREVARPPDEAIKIYEPLLKESGLREIQIMKYSEAELEFVGLLKPQEDFNNGDRQVVIVQKFTEDSSQFLKK